jgi:peptide/nickel transport system permease protein
VFFIKKFATAVLQFFLAIVGIICVSALPSLFQGMEIDVGRFIETTGELGKKLFTLTELTYWTNAHTSRPLFPEIFTYYSESILLFLFAFGLSIIFALIWTTIILHLKQKYIHKLKVILAFLESIPDLFIIVSFQLLIIWIYKQTDILLFNIASFGEEKSIFLPVVCLSILPTVMQMRILLLQAESELQKDYVFYAKAKGFTFMYIWRNHVLRNVAFTMIHYSKTIVWVTLSNLLMIEYLFNVRGIVYFTLKHPMPEVFLVCLLLIYVPFFVIYKVYDFVVPQVMKGEVSSV